MVMHVMRNFAADNIRKFPDNRSGEFNGELFAGIFLVRPAALLGW
jgi:hypothetical protein